MSDVVEPCKPEPCGACPWRLSNAGKPSPRVEGHRYGWYTRANLRRLWSGLRRGTLMTCHPTDPRHTQITGAKLPADIVTYQCTGAIILLQRELQRVQELTDFREYRRVNPNGLTRDGIAELVARILMPAIYGKLGQPNLNHADVSHSQLVPWEPRKR